MLNSYFPKTQIEITAYNEAIKRILELIQEKIERYDNNIKESIEGGEKSLWRHCKMTIMDFKEDLRQLLQTHAEPS